MSLFEKAKKIINRNQDLFIALEELDRTGKLPRISYKGRHNFTINEGVMRKFRDYCRKKGIKMSNKIEDLIRKEINLL